MQYDPKAALARIDNDIALMSMLINVFIKECPAYKARLENACSQHDVNALGDAAHNVKGASAAIGLDEVFRLAEQLEVACRQSGVKSIASLETSTAELLDLLSQSPVPLKAWIERQA